MEVNQKTHVKNVNPAKLKKLKKHTNLKRCVKQKKDKGDERDKKEKHVNKNRFLISI